MEACLRPITTSPPSSLPNRQDSRKQPPYASCQTVFLGVLELCSKGSVCLTRGGFGLGGGARGGFMARCCARMTPRGEIAQNLRPRRSLNDSNTVNWCLCVCIRIMGREREDVCGRANEKISRRVLSLACRSSATKCYPLPCFAYHVKLEARKFTQRFSC